MKLVPVVTIEEMRRGAKLGREGRNTPLPKHMVVPAIGLTVTDTPEARQMVALIREFGDRAYAISMRISVLARNAEFLGEHCRPGDGDGSVYISEAALAAVAEIPIINEADPGPEAILAAIKARGA